MFEFVLPFIILIIVVVFVHEYGHYYFARRYGVGVTDFSIGFGKELFGWNDKSGTRWKVCWIPLGGYVKFFGDRNVFSQSDQEKIIKKYNEEDRKKLFVLKPLYQRSLIVALAISLTISSIDTLVNGISSLIIVDGNKIIKFKGNYLKLSKQIIILISLISFFVASKGLSILYLFLLADLFCCAAVLSVFYSFYSKSFNEKKAIVSTIIGLVGGILLFPSPDFSKSLLVGIIFPSEFFPIFVSQSLLFCSFAIATFLPVISWRLK